MTPYEFVIRYEECRDDYDAVNTLVKEFAIEVLRRHEMTLNTYKFSTNIDVDAEVLLMGMDKLKEGDLDTDFHYTSSTRELIINIKLHKKSMAERIGGM